MRDALVELLKPGSILATIVITFFGVNGYFERRSKKREGKTSTHDEVTEAHTEKAIATSPDIDERWQRYADEIETRLRSQIEELIAETEKLRDEIATTRDTYEKNLRKLEWEMAKNAMLIDYIGSLRHHIKMGYGPPPPDWPQEYKKELT